MKRHLATIALSLWLGVSLTGSATAQGDSSAADRYAALVAAAKAGDPTVDWQALRFAYADSPGFDLYGMGQEAARKQMFTALNAGDSKAAIAAADQVLAADYVDIDAHVIQELAYRKLGDTVAADREHAIAVGLLHSIETGDGKTPETAFTVITVGEEYTVARLNGLTPRGQALVQSGGHSYDKLDLMDRDGKSLSLYFQIDRVWAAENAMFKPKS